MAVEIRLLGGLEVRLDGVPLDLGTQRARCVLAALLVHHGRTVSSGDLARRAWPGEPPATAEQQVRNYVGQLRRGPLASVAEQLRLQTRRPGYRAELAPGILDIDCFDDLLKRAKRAADTAEPNAAALFREALGLCRGRALDGLDTEYLQARAAILEDRRRDATLAFAELEASAGHYAEAAQALRDLAADRPDDAALHAAYLRAETRQAEEAERPAPPSAHKPLPTDTNAFTGRTAEVEDLLARAAEAGAERSPGATVVCAVDGMAGTGKTALAIHLAHQVAADFRDGQLFIDLHGYTQGLAPRDPKDALAALLQQLGVTSQECPDDLEGRAALYRARLADTATLILLDNALDEAQVAPLIPASEKSMVLITSRARLAALDDAWALSLEGLSVPDSIALFHKIAGPDRAATGGRELIDIVEHCAGLPLAVRIVAALFRNRRWTPAMLLERIGTLDGFSDGSRDLSSLFALSYETLDEPCRILFRLLGVMPGPDIEAQAAAALYAEKDVGALARRLERLADQNLVVERADGRYGMHDLVRLYARKLAAGDAEADTARGRLLDYYQEASDRANAQWLEQPEHARQWLRAERANLEACLMLAAELGQDDRVVALARGLSKILRMDGPWARAREIHTQVLAAARRAGDPRGEAEVLVRFGDIQRVSGGIEIARTALTEALEIYRGLDDHDGIHAALYRLGQVGLSCGDHCYAERYLREAVETEFRLSDPRGKSFAIVSLGDVCMRTGRSEEAERYYRQALATYRAVGSQTGEANALTKLASARSVLGEYSESLTLARQAHDIASAAGARWEQTYALRQLGCDYIELGLADEAEEAAITALNLIRKVGDLMGEAAALTVLAQAKRLKGELADAEKWIRKALALDVRLGAWGNHAFDLNVHATILFDGHRYADALALYRQAERANRECEKIDDIALSLEGIGNCLLALGDTHGGVERLNEALAIFERLGARALADHVRTRLQSLD